MIRLLTLLRLKWRAFWLWEQAVWNQEQEESARHRYELLVIELRKVRGRIATLEKPEVLLNQVLRRKA